MKKNILIIYTDYGTGHYMAAKGIEEHLKQKYPNHDIELFDPLSYSHPIINKLFAKTGQIVATRFRKFRKRLYDNQMYKNYLKKTWYFNILIKLFWTKRLQNKLLEYNPDIIISTQVGPTGLIAAHKTKLNVKIIAVYTDYGVHRMYLVPHKEVDKYCVPCESVKKHMIDLGISKNKIEVTGIPVRSQIINVDNSFKSDKIKKYPDIKNKPVFLFICGGGLGYDNAFKYFKSLLEIDYDSYYIFISGKNKKLYKKATKISKKYQKTGQVLGYVSNIGNLISISSLVIGKPGGIITSESLNIGTPLCAIEPIPGQEIHNANFISNNNFGFYIKNIQEFNELLEKIKNKKINLNEYKKSIKDNFYKFSFIDIEKL